LDIPPTDIRRGTLRKIRGEIAIGGRGTGHHTCAGKGKNTLEPDYFLHPGGNGRTRGQQIGDGEEVSSTKKKEALRLVIHRGPYPRGRSR